MSSIRARQLAGSALSKSRLAAGPVAVHPAASSPRRTIAVVGSGRAGAPHGTTRCPGLRRPGPWFSTEHDGSVFLLLLTAYCLLLAGCGYTTRPGLASYLKTIYIKPFTNSIDITQLSPGRNGLSFYRPGMEVDITNAVLRRFQFTGLLRPASAERADSRLEGELVEFRRDALRYDASQQVEEWRLSLVVNLRFVDRTTNTTMWEEDRFAGDTTFFTLGPKTESETSALSRAITDLAKRIVERTVESW